MSRSVDEPHLDNAGKRLVIDPTNGLTAQLGHSDSRPGSGPQRQAAPVNSAGSASCWRTRNSSLNDLSLTDKTVFYARGNTLLGIMGRGTKTCQGMNEWRVEDETGARISLRTVRDRAVDAGLL
ncbi:hypothetical protein [Streptomyces sp. NPDC059575]|uniref:hypothetical protein n=1 Tax=Streptomyces sp. NPDC059575 TaxID=3346872 RepID=UPI0036CE5B80